MALLDDLITAGVSAGLSGAAALAGAVIGARATRQASTEAFDQAARREEERWRRALHHECWQNINLQAEQQQDGRGDALGWQPDTRVLDECSAHATAFTPEVFQRIIWARTAVAQFKAALESARQGDMSPEQTAAGRDAIKYRRRALGEISEIETTLR